jgi:hypothetical protein
MRQSVLSENLLKQWHQCSEPVLFHDSILVLYSELFQQKSLFCRKCDFCWKTKKTFVESHTFNERVTFNKSIFMSMWARLGRFLEIYGPKFWDFQWKGDCQQKSKKTFDESHSFVERVTFVKRVLAKGPGWCLWDELVTRWRTRAGP